MRPSRLRVPPEILRLVMKVRSPYSEALVSGSVAFSIPFGRRAGGTAAPSNRRFSRAGAYFRPSACRRRPRSGFELAAFDWSNPNSEVAASRGKMGRGRCEPARGHSAPRRAPTRSCSPAPDNPRDASQPSGPGPALCYRHSRPPGHLSCHHADDADDRHTALS